MTAAMTSTTPATIHFTWLRRGRGMRRLRAGAGCGATWSGVVEAIDPRTPREIDRSAAGKAGNASLQARVKTAALLLAALFAFAIAGPACAQYGRHGSGPRERDTSPETEKDKDKPRPPDDPFSSLARELPSLRIDLGLTRVQVDAWTPFERDVRDLAEMATARRRHVMALREGGENPPNALTVISSIVEDDQMRAEAARDMKGHLGVLYALLDEGQKRLFDKRVVQSQTEPLGR